MRTCSSSFAGQLVTRSILPKSATQRFPATYPSYTRVDTPRLQYRSFHCLNESFVPRQHISKRLTHPCSRVTRPRVSPFQSTVRHCSHQRGMCRNMGADAADANMDISKGREVLPKNVKPLHYDLTLEPNFETF